MEHGGGLSVAEQGGRWGRTVHGGGRRIRRAFPGIFGRGGCLLFPVYAGRGKMETARWGGPVVKKL